MNSPFQHITIAVPINVLDGNLCLYYYDGLEGFKVISDNKTDKWFFYSDDLADDSSELAFSDLNYFTLGNFNAMDRISYLFIKQYVLFYV